MRTSRDTQGAAREATDGQGLQEVTQLLWGCREVMVAFSQGRMLCVGKELTFFTNVTKNETSQ